LFEYILRYTQIYLLRRYTQTTFKKRLNGDVNSFWKRSYHLELVEAEDARGTGTDSHGQRVSANCTSSRGGVADGGRGEHNWVGDAKGDIPVRAVVKTVTRVVGDSLNWDVGSPGKDNLATNWNWAVLDEDAKNIDGQDSANGGNGLQSRVLGQAVRLERGAQSNLRAAVGDMIDFIESLGGIESNGLELGTTLAKSLLGKNAGAGVRGIIRDVEAATELSLNIVVELISLPLGRSAILGKSSCEQSKNYSNAESHVD